MPVWNRTVALERIKDDEPLEDAFALLLKELRLHRCVSLEMSEQLLSQPSHREPT
jgi:hypothetical protein